MFTIKNGLKYFSEEIRSAIGDGDASTVCNLMEGLDLEEIKDHQGATLLHLSIKMKSKKVTEFLINKDCDIDAQDEQGTTPLLHAVKICDFLAIETLLEENAKMYLSDKYGMNPLKLILTHGQSTRVHLIKIFAKHLKGWTAETLAPLLLKAAWPIHYVIFIRDSELLRLMLKAGCPVDSRDAGNESFTALQAAVILQDVKSVKILLDYRAKLYNGTHCSANSITPLFLALTNPKVFETILDRHWVQQLFKTDRKIRSFEPFINVHRQIVKLLIFKYKMNLSVKDMKGNTILHYLILNWDPMVINLISKTDFDVNVRNDQGDTLLYNAMRHHRTHAIEMLINKGADINTKIEKGYTPLIIALICHAKEEKINFLLENGAILDEEIQSLVLKEVAEGNIPMEIMRPVLKRMTIMHSQGNRISRENLRLLKNLPFCSFEKFMQELNSM